MQDCGTGGKTCSSLPAGNQHVWEQVSSKRAGIEVGREQTEPGREHNRWQMSSLYPISLHPEPELPVQGCSGLGQQFCWQEPYKGCWGLSQHKGTNVTWPRGELQQPLLLSWIQWRETILVLKHSMGLLIGLYYNTYPITERLNGKMHGNFVFTFSFWLSNTVLYSDVIFPTTIYQWNTIHYDITVQINATRI